MITKKRIDPQKFGLTREQNLLESLDKLCQIERIQNLSTMIETKIEFAERTTQSLMKRLPLHRSL